MTIRISTDRRPTRTTKRRRERTAPGSRARRRRGYFVYLLRCGDRSYYTGYTIDPARRVAAHRDGRAARYTRGRGPFRLLVVWRCATLGAALRLEYRLKHLPRAVKHRVARGLIPENLKRLLGRTGTSVGHP